jgi:hypothetical protein
LLSLPHATLGLKGVGWEELQSIGVRGTHQIASFSTRVCERSGWVYLLTRVYQLKRLGLMGCIAAGMESALASYFNEEELDGDSMGSWDEEERLLGAFAVLLPAVDAYCCH